VLHAALEQAVDLELERLHDQRRGVPLPLPLGEFRFGAWPPFSTFEPVSKRAGIGRRRGLEEGLGLLHPRERLGVALP
jgi:hypothetical protein